MITIAHRKDSEDAKERILSACVKLFLEKGYHDTKMNDILSAAGVSNSTFQNLFHTKDGVLMDLTEFMFNGQFSVANSTFDKNLSPVFVYALETSIQMALTELNEHIREIYVYVYTLPNTTEYIIQKTSTELSKIFASYLPEYSESDFYEMDIGTCGVMRNYMARRCDKYFTLEKKLERFLTISLSAYNVPARERKLIIQQVLEMDIRSMADEVLQKLFQALAMKFEFKLDKGKND